MDREPARFLHQPSQKRNRFPGTQDPSQGESCWSGSMLLLVRAPDGKGSLAQPPATHHLLLLTNGGQRVELNALASDHFVTWLEAKLAAAGVVKMIPDDATLKAAYQRVIYARALNAKLKEFHPAAQAAASATVPPVSLRRAAQPARSVGGAHDRRP